MLARGVVGRLQGERSHTSRRGTGEPAMADQLPQFQGLTAAGMSEIAGIAMIAEEAAALVAREVAESGGGNYKFHPDELQAVLTQWKGLQQTITSAMGTVHTRTPQSGAVM